MELPERLITALIVDAFLLFVGFESALGQWLRQTYSTRIAVPLVISLIALPTWGHLRRADRKTERDKFQLWGVVSLFVALFVAFAQDQPPLPRDKAIGLFLIFSIGKAIYHGDHITGRT